jgi:hypothetical protein
VSPVSVNQPLIDFQVIFRHTVRRKTLLEHASAAQAVERV